MTDDRVGASIRAVRVRRRWRQADVAERAGVSRAFVSLVERGHLDRASLSMLRRVADALEMRVDVTVRWRAGEIDRLLNARHSALHESVALFLQDLTGWTFAPEVSFAIYGERGVIDILAFHAEPRCLLVIELKTEIVDVQELLGVFDRKMRLARRIAAERGWDATSVSGWVIVARSRTSQRRIEAHQTMLRAALPLDGHAMRAWLARPSGSVRGLSSWTIANPRSARRGRDQRIRAAAPR
jgi:transcriptional regulator with XRE-family HTH domain